MTMYVLSIFMVQLVRDFTCESYLFILVENSRPVIFCACESDKDLFRDYLLFKRYRVV